MNNQPKTMADDKRLAGLRVLLVEDEALILMVLDDIVSELGCVVAATAHNLATARAGAEKAEFDLAILDVSLNGERVDEVAETVLARGKTVLFATGRGKEGVATHLRHCHTIEKPYMFEHIRTGLLAALA